MSEFRDALFGLSDEELAETLRACLSVDKQTRPVEDKHECQAGNECMCSVCVDRRYYEGA